MKKFLTILGSLTLVLGIACLTGEIIGCFMTPIDGFLYLFGTTSHNTMAFLLDIPQYLISAGIIILAIAFIMKGKGSKEDDKLNLQLANTSKFGPWKKKRTVFQYAVLVIIFVHLILTVLGLTNIKGVCPRSLGDMAVKGELGISAVFWTSIIVLSLVWGRVLCGWLCVYAPVQETAANMLTGIGANPLKKKFVKKGLIYITTIAFWGSILFNIIKNINHIDFNINNGDSVNNIWLYVGGLITMLPLTLLFTHLFGNRFFCKYICPIGGLQSIWNKVSLLKVKIDHKKCVNCNACTKNCQMGVAIDNYIKEGDSCVRDGNCIMCGDCIDKCPKNALKFGIIERKSSSQINENEKRKTA
ncbi:4Fe-4S binding protein [Pseudobacteroides cellulosolvens]|uniref:4Fe-4S ferredoxin iron-sulfur binding domain-containing protein n=1 Tax=Pseudobacteroides cellulosolvens ATCC 35603 = DSM 2933 TaxID=398512 RepID=A0A0L6JXW5_9FIRM|nr:4Fe-4S binding protein [Pseudobacteroides cellulosolvens]KNY30287.1 4Fe-4S ferredoxin iron-sulfur binding domain-containing protein [Pseudobacteroides cellulosolvens ATCC 35603 = DSM 2933]